MDFALEGVDPADEGWLDENLNDKFSHLKQ